MSFIPHTEEDTALMLASIGESNTAALFDEIPKSLQDCKLEHIPSGLSEMEMLKMAEKLAGGNQNGVCFIGAGSYEHYIPAAVWEIASRGEFLTAYTPYQAEASQGTLQTLYEFQTMIAELTGMEVANASLYDGATALAEAALMAVRIQGRNQAKPILVAGTLHPYYRETLETIVRNQHIELISLPFDPEAGIILPEALQAYEDKEICALIIAQPNFFGCLEQVDCLTDWAKEKNALAIACVNPIALGLLKPPGLWGKTGADIVCGEGQPLGCPIASGGPYFGFFSTRMKYVRQMPGRLAGRTLDQEGKTGYTLTLQAREQHIRRGKATSNICTNQGLLVTAATIHMSLLGPEGLQRTAALCHHNTHELVEQLTAIEGVRQTFHAPFFHEALLSLEQPIEPVLQALREAGIAGGYDVSSHYPQFQNSLLVCATEMRTPEDIARYARTLRQILNQ